MGLTRRQFLKWSGATGVGAVVFAGCTVPQDEIRVQSPLQLPEDLVTGRDNFYATTFQSGSSSEGLLVRVMEGRAKKVEGNPDFPINTGKHGIRSEALLQALYHPDRIRGPFIRDQRGAPLRPATWPEALARLAEVLREADPSSVLMATAPYRGQLATVTNRFAEAYGAQLLGFDPLDNTVLRKAMQDLFNQGALPDFDLAKTNYLLNFGTDFLGTWIAPTHFMRGYGEFRHGEDRNGRRGHFVHVEPRMSTTAASADEWVYVNPGSEGLLAMSMAYVIISNGLGDADAAAALTGGRGASALSRFEPSRVAAEIGIPGHHGAERIEELALAFAAPKNRPALAIGGGAAAAHTNGLFNLKAIYSLNFLVGSVHQEGGLIFNASRSVTRIPEAPLRTWSTALDQMRAGEVNVLLVRDANLVHGLPGSLKTEEALRNIGTIVSFSSFADETTALADLILPGHTPLEEWGSDTPEPGPGYITIGLQQPVVNPFFNTTSFGDVLLATARELGFQDQLPWENMREAVRDSVRPLHQLGIGSVSGGVFDEFWHVVLQRGGWWNDKNPVITGPTRPPQLPTSPEFAELKGNEKDYPFYLVPFESQSLGAGQHAHLPWMQATPDPMTTVVWQTWVEVNPRVAKEMGIRNDDVVIVESGTGETIEAVVYENPATPPNVVAVPFGQGHTQASSFAANRGSNALQIVGTLEERETGALAWAANRARLAKTTKRVESSKYEGNVPAYELPDDKIIHITRPE
jgi:anaerobic selenocysteine-containing dehydrogenase